MAGLLIFLVFMVAFLAPTIYGILTYFWFEKEVSDRVQKELIEKNELLEEENEKLDSIRIELENGLDKLKSENSSLQEEIKKLNEKMDDGAKRSFQSLFSQRKLLDEAEQAKKNSKELMDEVDGIRKAIKEKEEEVSKLMSDRETQLQGLRSDLYELAKRADEDSKLIDSLVDILGPKFKKKQPLSSEFYSQSGPVCTGFVGGPTTYLQRVSLILSHRLNPLDSCCEDEDE